MTMPSEGEEYAKLTEHIRKAQESAAMLSHLTADNNKKLSTQWLQVSEMFKQILSKVTDIAMRKLQ